MNRAPYPKFLFLSILLFCLFPPTAAPVLPAPPDGGCFVYPSPAAPGGTAWVVYDMPTGGTADIFVYNEAGDLVTQETAPTAAGTFQTSIDLTHYRRGVYICQVVLHLDSGATQALQLCKFIVSQ